MWRNNIANGIVKLKRSEIADVDHPKDMTHIMLIALVRFLTSLNQRDSRVSIIANIPCPLLHPFPPTSIYTLLSFFSVRGAPSRGL